MSCFSVIFPTMKKHFSSMFLVSYECIQYNLNLFNPSRLFFSDYLSESFVNTLERSKSLSLRINKSTSRSWSCDSFALRVLRSQTDIHLAFFVLTTVLVLILICNFFESFAFSSIVSYLFSHYLIYTCFVYISFISYIYICIYNHAGEK